MSSTHLVEFKNSRNITLRGILIESTNTISKTAVVCVAGFEGLSSTAPKFINLTEELFLLPSSPVASVFRYDPTGIGLSDGIYYKMTIDTLVDDLSHAMNYLKTFYKSFIFIGHSLGSCVIAKFLNSNQNCFIIEKIILLAPALNQYDLHRYWYMQQIYGFITWENFKKDFHELDFQEYLNNKPIDACKSHRAHKILFEFIRLCSQEDFSFKLNDYQNQILHIHGTQDAIVPIESIKDQFKNTLILNTNDHDLEEPNILQEWTMKAVKFICNNK
ncbi:unnamed protein product [Rotaria sp. Silwood2]|nr:unnamed protein product [Rotaria sp. Silwood2]CAF2945427.1 unnamed protein product [Rotaria sp. Silwood2]CAF3116640.1 unnamed protein product [Rotaria sp. Silwood2]CAF4054088.1 unnamed protein product [Rotaria sp. Silwood2]CAF4212368.1 unnamed protein product [Rotaria sp. Silwood2]